MLFRAKVQMHSLLTSRGGFIVHSLQVKQRVAKLLFQKTVELVENHRILKGNTRLKKIADECR